MVESPHEASLVERYLPVGHEVQYTLVPEQVWQLLEQAEHIFPVSAKKPDGHVVEQVLL